MLTIDSRSPWEMISGFRLTVTSNCNWRKSAGVLDDLINPTWITFKSGMCFIDWQDGPCSPAKISWEMFLASPFEPYNGAFLLIELQELAGPYPSILLGFTGYFWAQSLHYQFLSFKNVAFFVFLLTAIASFTPLFFHLVLKRAPRFLSPVRHVDLSQGRARKASWSMSVLGHRQKCFNLFQFHLRSIDFALRLISFNTEGFDFLSNLFKIVLKTKWNEIKIKNRIKWIK